jgi:hypothetical protein
LGILKNLRTKGDPSEFQKGLPLVFSSEYVFLDPSVDLGMTEGCISLPLTYIPLSPHHCISHLLPAAHLSPHAPQPPGDLFASCVSLPHVHTFYTPRRREAWSRQVHLYLTGSRRG